MNYIKEATISELKRDHSERHGFLFKSSNNSSNQSIEALAGVLKKQGIAKSFPLLVARLAAGIVFVYEDFDGPRFWQLADYAGKFMGIEVVPLVFFLSQAQG